MKKFRALTLILAIVMMFSVASFSAFAEGEAPTPSAVETETPSTPSEPSTPTEPSTPAEPEVDYKTSGEWQYKDIDDKTVELVGYTGASVVCELPSKISETVGETKVEKAVVSIASGVITNNATITSIKIPGSVKTMKADSFIGCYALKEIKVEKGNLQEFDVGFCSSLEIITLPENVKTIGKLDNCPMLHKIVIDGKNSAFKSVDGVVYSADGKTLVKYPAGKKVSRFAVPAGVTQIADYAFYQAKKNVTEIFVPTSVVKMGANTFKDAVITVLFQADKLPDGCKDAVNGLKTAFTQVNLYSPKKIASTQNATAIKLTWEKVEGATGYGVFQKVSGKWKKIGSVAKTDGTIKNLKTGTKYEFAVQAYVKTAKGVVWAQDYITHKAATTSAAPAQVVSAKNDTQIKLTWSKVSGVTGYAVYYKHPKDGWKLQKDMKTARTVTFSKLTPYTTYTFAVRTYIKTGDKTVLGASKQISVKTNIGTPIVSGKKIVESNVNKIEFTWTPSVGASHYQVYVKKDNGDWAVLGTYTKVENVKFATTGQPAGTKISITVRAYRQESGKVVAKSDYKAITATV